MKVFELITEGMEKAKAEKLAAEYIALHNEISKKYGEAFKKIGVRRWPMDKTHPLKAHNQAAKARSLQQLKGNTADLVRIERPLTVLDAYPDTSEKDRAWLNAEVDKIWNEGKKRLAQIKKTLL